MVMPRVIPQFVVGLFCAVALSSCINDPINSYTAGKYYGLAREAEVNGELMQARIFYSRSYINTKLGHQPPEVQAHALFEWARVSGYLGYYAGADKGYADVLDLVAKAEGRAASLLAPTCCERARLLRDSCQDQRAVPIYAQAVRELEKAKVDQTSPLLFADYREDSELALRNSGAAVEAGQLAARTRELRELHRGTTPHFSGAANFQAAGHAAYLRNDWYSASVNYWRAVREAELCGADANLRAVVNYEYGRSLGVMGRFAKAEVYLLRALQFDRDAHGKIFLDLNELARLNFDQKNFAKANEYFQAGIAAIDDQRMADDFAAGFVDLLLEYASSLRAVGREVDAHSIDLRVAEIRKLHPTGKSITERTPYGKYPPTGLPPLDPGPESATQG